MGVSVSDSIGGAVLTLREAGVVTTLELSDFTAGKERNYISSPAGWALTPDSAAISISGDIDIRVKGAMNDWTPASPQSLFAKWGLNNAFTADGPSYTLYITSEGKVTFSWFQDDPFTLQREATSPSATSAVNGEAKWVRATLDVDNGAGSCVATFYESDDGVTWTSLGAHTQAFITNIRDTIAELAAPPFQQLQGKIYFAEVRNGINGELVARFDPNDHQLGTTFVSATTGETWTLNSEAALNVVDNGALTLTLTEAVVA